MILLGNKYIYILSNLLVLLLIIYLSIYLIWKLNYKQENVIENYDDPSISYKGLNNSNVNNIYNENVNSVEGSYYIIKNNDKLFYNLNRLTDTIGKEIIIKTIIQLETINTSINEVSLFKVFSNINKEGNNNLNTEYINSESILDKNRYIELYLVKNVDDNNFSLKLRNHSEYNYNFDTSYTCKEGDIIALRIEINPINLATADTIYKISVKNIFNIDDTVLEPTEIVDYSSNSNTSTPQIFIDTDESRTDVDILERSVAQIGFDIIAKNSDSEPLTDANLVKINLIKLDLLQKHS
jgi:hypothetical protein